MYGVCYCLFFTSYPFHSYYSFFFLHFVITQYYFSIENVFMYNTSDVRIIYSLNGKLTNCRLCKLWTVLAEQRKKKKKKKQIGRKNLELISSLFGINLHWLLLYPRLPYFCDPFRNRMKCKYDLFDVLLIHMHAPFMRPSNHNWPKSTHTVHVCFCSHKSDGQHIGGGS